MSDLSIRVEGLSKQYRIGARTESYFTLRDSLSELGAKILGSFSRNDQKDQEQPLFWALKGVSFEAQQGEVIGVVGPNGAGKTTLLKVLSRVTEPTAGRVEIRGRVGSLLEVGTGFHPELTGRENIFLSGAILGMKRVEIDRKFDEIVAFAGVEEFIDTPVKRFSTGMYLRLAFSVAAHLEPEILLVDEVLAVGDLDFQKKCLGKMGTVAREGRTVLLVSHNLTAINTLCRRSILLSNGQIVIDGLTSDVTQKYVASVAEKGGQVIWNKPHAIPGNHRVKLRAVRVLSSIGEIRGEFDINEDIFVHVVYQNLIEGEKYHVVMYLKDELGNIVFESVNVPSENLIVDEWFDRPYCVGFFETVCRIPANLLTIGRRYVIDIHTVNHAVIFTRKGDLYEQNVLSFKITDYGSRDIYGYGTSWPGIVRPKLAWSTRYLGEGDPTGGLLCSAGERRSLDRDR